MTKPALTGCLDPFDPDEVFTGSLIDRVNRFVVRCRTTAFGTVDAFLPNPGRLWELLLPGATVYLADRARPIRESAGAYKTKCVVLAVERDGAPVFLHTHLANRIARLLIQQNRIPQLAGAEVVAAEVCAGSSRFDFLLRRAGHSFFLEVKSCTLYGNRVAMFPDAVTERGRRHLLELASLKRSRARHCVLFLIHTPYVDWFMPDYHTDYVFGQTMLDLSSQLTFLPIAVQWTRRLELGPLVKTVPIPWAMLRREIKDRGSYLLLMHLAKDTRVTVGGLGAHVFRRGYYIYVGSAMANLSQRVARHLRRQKKLHWHIDYLRQVVDRVTALPVRSSVRQECQIVRTLAELFRPGPRGFGSSDCTCPAHLLWHESNPLSLGSFHAILQAYRMRPPDIEQLAKPY